MFETVLGVVLGGVITIIVTIVTEYLRRPKLVISPADPLYYPVTGPKWASLRLRVSNKALKGFLRQPAIQSKASITFSPLDGQHAFERPMAGRWASAPEPTPLQIITGGQPAFLIDPTRLEAGSRIDILPGETVELDIAAQFEDGCFGWNMRPTRCWSLPYSRLCAVCDAARLPRCDGRILIWPPVNSLF